jgi:hypothetical protein
MTKYTVWYEQTRSNTIVVDADNEEEAREKAEKEWTEHSDDLINNADYSHWEQTDCEED